MRREILTLHARAALQEETIKGLQQDKQTGDAETELRKRIGDLRVAVDSVKESGASSMLFEKFTYE